MANKERGRVERRIMFSHADKEALAKKSRKRCACCGKKLPSVNDMTVEHVIPLSKGGTNDFKNLVILCKNCNEGKSDSVLIPWRYCKYVSKSTRKELVKMFQDYCEDMYYITDKNFLYADVIPVDVELRMGGMSRYFRIMFELHKAVYSDLDSIYRFLSGYIERFGLDVDSYNIVRKYFDRGVIYFSKDRNGCIDYVFLSHLCCFRAKDEEGKTYRMFGFSTCIMANPELSLKRVRENKSEDYSYVKLLYMVRQYIWETSFLNLNDIKIDHHVSQQFCWYDGDERMSDFFIGLMRDCANDWGKVCMLTKDSFEKEFGMTSIQIDSCVNEIDSYRQGESSGWNKFAMDRYNVKSEIALFSVLRGSSYCVEIGQRAKELLKDLRNM